MAITETVTAPAVRWPKRATWMVAIAALAALAVFAVTQLADIDSAAPTAVDPASRSVDFAIRHPDVAVDMSSSRVVPQHDYGVRHLQPATNEAGASTAQSYADYARAMSLVPPADEAGAITAQSYADYARAMSQVSDGG